MKSSQFIHDKPSVMKTLVEQEDGSVKTKTGCRIFIPKRFLEKSMAEIGSDNYSIGMFPIVTDDNKFLFFNAIAYVYLNPSEFNTVYIDHDEFIEFKFDPGTVVIKSLALVQKDTLVYSVFNEFISSGNIPWYIDYESSATLFDSATTIAGTSVGKNPETIEILTAVISRQEADKTQYLRTQLRAKEDSKKLKTFRVPLKSVSFSATNTTNKLAGARYDEGIISALNNPTTRPDTIGTILRK